jgi:hypothetical protein
VVLNLNVGALNEKVNEHLLMTSEVAEQPKGRGRELIIERLNGLHGVDEPLHIIVLDECLVGEEGHQFDYFHGRSLLVVLDGLLLLIVDMSDHVEHLFVVTDEWCDFNRVWEFELTNEVPDKAEVIG